MTTPCLFVQALAANCRVVGESAGAWKRRARLISVLTCCSPRIMKSVDNGARGWDIWKG
jgi:hypothetical protein